MKILVTGIAGFAARHFLNLLNEKEPGSEIAGIYHERLPDLDTEGLQNLKIRLHKADLGNRDAFEKIAVAFQPEFILHLAGRSSVAASWKDPVDSITGNTNFFLNIVETVRLNGMTCRILSIGSTEEYGNANEGKPLRETDCPEPASPYGVARVLQQKLVAIYAASYGLDIVHTRSFNHIGPHQRAEFVISSFAKQVAQQMKKGSKKLTLTTGDVNVIRDFSDVRDVVRAYYLLMLHGKSGETYNVCSGRGVRLREVIDMLSAEAGMPIEQITDEKYFRPSENKIIVGSYEKLKSETGWRPEITLETSLGDILNYWKSVQAL